MSRPAGPDRRRPPPQRRSRSRSSEGGLWLYGLHPVLAAIVNPHRQISRVLATTAALPQLTRAMAEAAPDRPRPAVECVDGRAIDQLLPPGAVHQGAAALVMPLAAPDLDQIAAAAGPAACVLILDQVTDPRNVGAVLRSAAAFRVDAVIVQDRHAPETTGALAKAAAGALERVPLVRVTNLARALDALNDHGFCTVGLDGAATRSLADADLAGRVALVLGSEGSGLRRLVRETCDLLVRIPIAPAVESLNVATAAAVALYELRRGRPPPR